MAKITDTYREKRIIIISSKRSATSQFEHNGYVYQEKVKNVDITPLHLAKLSSTARIKIDEILGPERAEHLLKT